MTNESNTSPVLGRRNLGGQKVIEKPLSFLPVLLLAFSIAVPVQPLQAYTRNGPDATRPQEKRSISKGQAVEFDHSACPDKTGSTECRASYVLDLANGESFNIIVKNTLPNQFTFTVAGIPVASAGNANKAQAAELRDTTLTQQHDARFGGYIVTIRRKPEIKTPLLPDATIVIAVRTNEWQAAFGGGFTVSNLIGRVYALRDSVIPAIGQTPASTKSLVVRDEQREDDATYGTATFVHLYHSKHPWAAVSFGLGLSLNNATGSAYYLGPSYRFGDRGALTIGGVVGPVRTLPAGIRENDVASDRTTVSNALASPPTRNAVKAFIALSYNFLGGGPDALNKPFAGSTTSTSAAGVTTPAPSQNQSESAGPKAELAANPLLPKAGSDVEFTVRLTNVPTTQSLAGVPVTVSPNPGSALAGPLPTKLDFVRDGSAASAKFTAKVNQTVDVTVKVSGVATSELSAHVNLTVTQ